ncbi:MAG: hypothetical protein HY568_00840 [Candidatus Latescibacteria bacterium]|nr:hypothetical protein [Candidatus Latescibacterota bacterium]
MDWFRDQVKKGMNPRTYVLVGFLVAVLFWIHSLDVKQKSLRARNAASGSARVTALAAPEGSKRGNAVAAVSTPAGWARDPFERRVIDAGEQPGRARVAPRGGTAPATTGLYLQGIMIGPMGRTALINGEIYREGQRIGVRELIQIGRRSVMILDRGTVTTLTLKGEG